MKEFFLRHQPKLISFLQNPCVVGLALAAVFPSAVVHAADEVWVRSGSSMSLKCSATTVTFDATTGTAVCVSAGTTTTPTTTTPTTTTPTTTTPTTTTPTTTTPTTTTPVTCNAPPPNQTLDWNNYYESMYDKVRDNFAGGWNIYANHSMLETLSIRFTIDELAFPKGFFAADSFQDDFLQYVWSECPGSYEPIRGQNGTVDRNGDGVLDTCVGLPYIRYDGYAGYTPPVSFFNPKPRNTLQDQKTCFVAKTDSAGRPATYYLNIRANPAYTTTKAAWGLMMSTRQPSE